MKKYKRMVVMSVERYEALIEKEKALDKMTQAKKAKGEVKYRFGEFGNVQLTKREYDRLCMEYPYEAEDAIRFFDEYIEMKGKNKYANHNLAIRKWVFDAVREQRVERARIEENEARYHVRRPGPQNEDEFDLEDLFE